mgnify:CR=1 FL=1
MFYDTVTRVSLLFLSYEIITLDIVKAKLIDVLLDKIIYIIIGIFIYILGYFSYACCSCFTSSKEENEIINFINAGDKMNQLDNSGDIYYQRAISKYHKTIPFQNISKKTINKINYLKEENKLSGSIKKSKKKNKAAAD